jgi:hypothetical protein
MTTKLLTLIILIVLYSCNNHDSGKVETTKVTSKNTFNHPDNFTTPNGQEIKFFVKDSTYYAQWKQADSIRTVDYSFDLIEGGNVSFPILVAENKNYILLRHGCGSPCWNGFFLPLYKAGNQFIKNNYLAYDLDKELVAYINDNDSLEIYNLRSGIKQTMFLDKCESVFKGYCIDTAYFENNYFHYSWTSDAHTKSGKNQLRKVKLE